MVNMNMVREAIREADAIYDYEVQILDEKDIKKLMTAISRMNLIVTTDRDFNPVLEYMYTVIYGMAIAKKALGNKSFGGSMPKSNEFGVTKLSPGYFGYDSWIDNVNATAGNTVTFVDSSVPPNLGGTPGNPIKIGRPVGVHMILGVRSFTASPGVERMQVTKNGTPLHVIDFNDIYDTDLHIKLLPDPIILVGGNINDEVKIDLFCGATTTDSFGLYGVSFLTQDALRILDPANMVGTSIDSIVVQQ